MKNIMVTGGSGFIGTNLIHYLYNKGYNVINYDKLTYASNIDGDRDLRGKKNYTMIKADILDAGSLESVVQSYGIDTIIHLAAESHVDNSITNPNIFAETNVMGTLNVLNVAKDYNLRLHHVSTDEVFGEIIVGSFNEDSKYDPHSPYSASKAASDHLVRSYIRTYGLKATISNCSNNYGPYQHIEKLIPKAITNVLNNKKVPIYGKGNNIRDWIYVGDHCEALYKILTKGKIGETYCVGADEEYQNKQLIYGILELMGKNPEEHIEYVEDRKGHDLRYSIDNSKIVKELKWKPQTDIIGGLERTIDWYKSKHL